MNKIIYSIPKIETEFTCTWINLFLRSYTYVNGLIKLLSVSTVQTRGAPETSVAKSSPATPVNSSSSSDPSDPSGWILSEECNSVDEQAYGASQHANLGTAQWLPKNDMLL